MGLGYLCIAEGWFCQSDLRFLMGEGLGEVGDGPRLSFQRGLRFTKMKKAKFMRACWNYAQGGKVKGNFSSYKIIINTVH